MSVKRSAGWSRLGSIKRRKLRLRLVERDGPNCYHCGRETFEHGRIDGLPTLPDQRTVDHFPVARANLPKTEWLNIDRCVISCFECNQRLNTESQPKHRRAVA